MPRRRLPMPTASPTTQGQSVTINVLANDFDPNGLKMYVDGVTQTIQGTVKDNGDGTLTYTPEADFVGSETFKCWVTDHNGKFTQQYVTVTVNADPGSNGNQAPLVTASNVIMSNNQSVAASLLFTATDPDGDTITTYALKDVTGNGHFVVNGVSQATNVEIDLTATQLAQTTYQAGAAGSDQISIRASDGTLWSAWQSSTVAVDRAPVVTAQNKTLVHNQTVAASSLFTAADPDGNTITTYALKDVTGNGHFVVNGVTQATNVEIDLTAAQLAQTTYVAGSATDQLSVRASDGMYWSAWQGVTATVARQIKRRSSPR